MLLELQGVAGEADVVIGGEQGDQAEHKAAQGLEEAEAIEAWPGNRCCRPFWRSWGRLAVGGWSVGTGGWGHGAGAAAGSKGSKGSVPPLGLNRHTTR